MVATYALDQKVDVTGIVKVFLRKRYETQHCVYQATEAEYSAQVIAQWWDRVACPEVI